MLLLLGQTQDVSSKANGGVKVVLAGSTVYSSTSFLDELKQACVGRHFSSRVVVGNLAARTNAISAPCFCEIHRPQQYSKIDKCVTSLRRQKCLRAVVDSVGLIL